ncbi:MAG TPA: DUF4145 domain-containing protein, partial [Terriglobales bacterium]|nr:DUF4145 domain-containing protein [Terriglobales bacterium]
DHLSKRAPLLAEILRYINDGRYGKTGEAWSFGLGQGASPEHCTKDEAIFRQMRRLVYDHVARTVALQRTSLSGLPTVDSLADEFKKLMDELTPVTREALGHAISPIAEGQDSLSPEEACAPGNQLDALDRYYAEEILEKLDRIVFRASTLDRMGLEIVPNRRVQLLFEEAHRCYLYGFHLACAVFCRAILEGALKEVADPHSETNQSIHEMIAMAVEKGVLTDDRPRCAREVAKAGNRAIHDPEMFDRDYSAEKVQEVLINTRKVLEELYRLSSA